VIRPASVVSSKAETDAASAHATRSDLGRVDEAGLQHVDGTPFAVRVEKPDWATSRLEPSRDHGWALEDRVLDESGRIGSSERGGPLTSIAPTFSFRAELQAGSDDFRASARRGHGRRPVTMPLDGRRGSGQRVTSNPGLHFPSSARSRWPRDL